MAKSGYKSKNVGVDYSEFQRKAKRLAKQYNIDQKEFIKDQSRLLAREGAKFTPPYSGFPDWNRGTAVATKKDIEVGENAIKRDIKRICYIVRDHTAWAWREKYGDNALIYNGLGVPIASGVITNGTKLYRWHQENKRKDGRTKTGLKPPQMPAVGRELVNEYIKDQQKHVGIAKAALWKASLAFGGKPAAPLKIKRHKARVSGVGVLKKTAKGYDGLITGVAEGLYHLKAKMPHLMRNRMIKAEKRLKILAKESAKKAGFKTR